MLIASAANRHPTGSRETGDPMRQRYARIRVVSNDISSTFRFRKTE